MIVEEVNKAMAENKRKAQLSLDGSSPRPRIIADTTDTSGGSIPVTINVPLFRGLTPTEKPLELDLQYIHDALRTEQSIPLPPVKYFLVFIKMNGEQAI